MKFTLKFFVLFRDHWLVLESLILLMVMVVNAYFVGWDTMLQENEIMSKATSVLKKINGIKLSLMHISTFQFFVLTY